MFFYSLFVCVRSVGEVLDCVLELTHSVQKVFGLAAAAGGSLCEVHGWSRCVVGSSKALRALFSKYESYTHLLRLHTAKQLSCAHLADSLVSLSGTCQTFLSRFNQSGRSIS